MKTKEKVYFCEVCGHRWNPRRNKIPKRCPSCKSRNWNKRKAKNILKFLISK